MTNQKKKFMEEIPRIGSEYSDEVTKINKKEDLMLERRLRYLERQERVSQSMARKAVHEIHRLKSSILDNNYRAPDLMYYDMKRTERLRQKYTRTKHNDMDKSFRLPPISNDLYSSSTTPRTFPSHGFSKAAIGRRETHHQRACALEREKMMQIIASIEKQHKVKQRNELRPDTADEDDIFPDSSRSACNTPDRRNIYGGGKEIVA